jgi:dTDP-4-dehydrorhamnose reductase
MEKVLIVGVETVAGSNLAAVLAPGFETVGLTTSSSVQIENCRITQLRRLDQATVSQIVQTERPDQIVFCGAAACSSWDEDPQPTTLEDQAAIAWAKAADQFEVGFTFVSSDAVFTGPWMSHNEQDTHFCETPQATLIRQAEADVKQACPNALVIRTNVFGWGATGNTTGFAERILTSLENGSSIELDPLRYAAPILSSDLAAVLLKAWEAGQTGFLHVAGAERINPCQFAERIAAMAELPIPHFTQRARLSRPVTGFGRGETMLNCRKARRLLGVSMPLIDEGIERMLEQRENGFLAQLRCESATVTRVA